MKRKNRELMLAMEVKIAGLEEIVRRQNIALEAHRERLSDHDECLEAWGEDFKKTVGSIQNIRQGVQDLMHRILDLERITDRQDDARVTLQKNTLDLTNEVRKMHEWIENETKDPMFHISDLSERVRVIEDERQDTEQIIARVDALEQISPALKFGIVNSRQRLVQLERTKDVQIDVSNRQAAIITALQKEVAALRDSQKSNLVMEKRPVGRPRPKVPK